MDKDVIFLLACWIERHGDFNNLPLKVKDIADSIVDNIGIAEDKDLLFLQSFLVENIEEEEDSYYHINIEYAGYGDSGDHFEIFEQNCRDETADFIEEFLYYFSSYITYDWYNNEGGGGNIILNFSKKSIFVDGYYNETKEIRNVDTQFSKQFKSKSNESS